MRKLWQTTAKALLGGLLSMLILCPAETFAAMDTENVAEETIILPDRAYDDCRRIQEKSQGGSGLQHFAGEKETQETDLGEQSGSNRKAKTAVRAMAATQGNLTVKEPVYYDGWSTNYFEVDGNMAYCSQPAWNTPPGGSYNKIYQFTSYLPSRTDWQQEVVRRVMWGSWGAPGFDAADWPQTWYDGTAMNADRYVALAHILISDVYSYDGMAALAGCSETFAQWAAHWVIGYDIFSAQPQIINQNATRFRLIDKGAPESFRVCILDTGNISQNILSFEYEPKGKIYLKKVSANPELTDENPNYSLKDTLYVIYGKEEDAKEQKNGISFLLTDESGVSGEAELDAGTYFIREEQAPRGYVLSPRIYEVTIKDGETFELYAEDIAQSRRVKVVKKDKDTGKVIPLAGVQFRLLDENQVPIGMKTEDSAAEDCEIFETDAEGQLTFPQSLAYGTYYLEEVKAPEGYLKGERMEFQISEDGTWETPLVLEYADENAMGKIRVEKTDEETKEPLSGAVFEITAAEDIKTADGTVRLQKGETADIVTTENGTAESKLLFLGSYIVRETKQPDGYMPEQKEYAVSLVYADQNTAVVIQTLTVENKKVPPPEPPKEEPPEEEPPEEEPPEEEPPKEEPPEEEPPKEEPPEEPPEEEPPKEETPEEEPPKEEPPKEEPSKEEPSEEEPPKETPPKTGDAGNIPGYILLLLTAGSVAAVTMLFRKNVKKKRGGHRRTKR